MSVPLFLENHAARLCRMVHIYDLIRSALASEDPADDQNIPAAASTIMMPINKTSRFLVAMPAIIGRTL